MKMLSPFAALLAAFALTVAPVGVSTALASAPSWGGITSESDENGDGAESERAIPECQGDSCDGDETAGYILEDDADAGDAEHGINDDADESAEEFSIDDDADESEEEFSIEDESEDSDDEFTMDDTEEEEDSEAYVLEEGDDDSSDESFQLEDEEEEEGEI